MHDPISKIRTYQFAALLSHDPDQVYCARMRRIRLRISININDNIMMDDSHIRELCQRMETTYSKAYPGNFRKVTFEDDEDKKLTSFYGGTDPIKESKLFFYDVKCTGSDDVITKAAEHLLTKIPPEFLPAMNCYELNLLIRVPPSWSTYNPRRNRALNVRIRIETKMLVGAEMFLASLEDRVYLWDREAIKDNKESFLERAINDEISECFCKDEPFEKMIPIIYEKVNECIRKRDGSMENND